MKAQKINGSNGNREVNDFYPTPEIATLELLNNIKIFGNVWEPACGEGHLSKCLEQWGFKVKSSDLIDRGYGEQEDFLLHYNQENCDIITNPPYKLAEEFIKHSMEILQTGNKAIFFLKVQFLEGQSRLKNIFKKYPPRYVYVHSERQQCSKNADFENLNSNTLCYIWIIFEVGFCGETILRWI